MKNTFINALKTGLASEAGNTNIETVFDLILKTAPKNHLKQDEIPEKMFMSGETDPREALLERINGERYAPVRIHLEEGILL